jgi:hypothetical protein
MGTTLSLARAADYKKPAVVVILGPEPIVHKIEVVAKQWSEPPGEISMRAGEDVGDQCLDRYRDPETGVCPYQDYLGVTDIYFNRPTTLPRPITVNMEGYTIHVSTVLSPIADMIVYLRFESGDGRTSCRLEYSQGLGVGRKEVGFPDRL